EVKKHRQDPKEQRVEKELAHVLKEQHLEEVADYNFFGWLVRNPRDA
ncbi:MAG: hypothetical protein JKY22_03560, partial [Flavobacteriaceae bacterium]|nr:hypothetical protein [Flavobacteriaceae bacterium]